MKILVVSDTHGRDENFEQAVMQETPFDMLIHCGDVEGREIFIEALTECPCHIVSGNNDFFSDLPREEIVEAGNNRIFVTHGHFGHTHKPLLETIDGVLALNPGSLTYPRQRGRRPSYAIVNLDQTGRLTAELKYL